MSEIEAAQPKTISVPEAGAQAGLSKNSAYAAAHRGEIPTLKFGRLMRVPLDRWQRMLKGEGV